MGEFLYRSWEQLTDRWGGPLSFRFLVQPLMGILLATRAGLRDAREGRPPFGWALFADTAQRRSLIRCGWRDVWRLFVFALTLDVTYQVVMLRAVYPGQALIVSALLALVPYLFARGLVNRLARRIRQRRIQRGDA